MNSIHYKIINILDTVIIPCYYHDSNKLPNPTVNTTEVVDVTMPYMRNVIFTPDGVHRCLYQDAIDSKVVPSIPVQPISYKDAVQFLSRIGGDEAPADWQGQLNITYNIGPSFDNG